MTLEDIALLESCWEYLEKTNDPIFIYGMGDGCVKLLNELNKRSIPVSGIFASDEFVRGHSFEGHKVHKFPEIEKACADNGYKMIILLAFAAGYKEIIEKIDSMDKKYTLFVPDTAVIGGEPFLKEHFILRQNDIHLVYDLLADKTSKKVFENLLAYKITGKIGFLKEAETPPEEAYNNILKLSSDEIYVDLGAYNGDTIEEFLNFTREKYKKIIALEPNKRNFKKLCQKTSTLCNCDIYNAAAWSENTILRFEKNGGRQSKITSGGIETPAMSVDEILKGHKATYIKYDVEGSEARAISGSAETIKKYSPALCAAVYHRLFDFIDIPLAVHRLSPDYKLYLRHYPYYPAWETNLFAVT